MLQDNTMDSYPCNLAQSKCYDSDKLNIPGELAQMVERSLSMREVPGSMPGFSM